ncbi:MAG: hypothetical protein MUF49_23535 [Oculatellaceae cyanobacterium Prado106]|nr:hypothetical protein [Oculatellaceae cyanobacterium Prado106]
MSPIHTKLIDSLASIILSLTEEEQSLLKQKIQQSQHANTQHYSDAELQQQQEFLQSLQQEIAIGIEQLSNGEYQKYDDSTLPNLLQAIKSRSQH